MGRENQDTTNKKHNHLKTIIGIVFTLFLIGTLAIGLLRNITINGETAPAYQHILEGNTSNQEESIMAPLENYENNDTPKNYI